MSENLENVQRWTAKRMAAIAQGKRVGNRQ